MMSTKLPGVPATTPMPAVLSQPQIVGQSSTPSLPQGIIAPGPGRPQIALPQPPNPLPPKRRIPKIFPFIKKHDQRIDGIITKIGRLGFLARGLIWASIGGVAISSVFNFNKGVTPESQTGALDAVADAVGGDAFLCIATIGIFAYALWRTSEFLWGLRVKPDMSGAMVFISGYLTPLCSLIFYGIFAYSNIHEVIYDRRQGGQGTFWNTLSESFGGSIFLTFVALIMYAVALGWIAQMIKGDTVGEMLNHKLIDKDPKPLKVLLYVTAYLGTTGRSFLFALVGTLFVRMAWFDWSDPQGTFGSALAQLLTGQVGRAFLFIEGFLLIVFGIFSCLNARYKEFLPYKAHLIDPAKHRRAEAKISSKLGPKWGAKFEGALAHIRRDRKEYDDAYKEGKIEQSHFDRNRKEQGQGQDKDLEAQFSPAARRSTPIQRKKRLEEPAPALPQGQLNQWQSRGHV